MLCCWTCFGNFAALSRCYAVELLLETLRTALDSWCYAVEFFWISATLSRCYAVELLLWKLCQPLLTLDAKLLTFSGNLAALSWCYAADLFWKFCQRLLTLDATLSTFFGNLAKLSRCYAAELLLETLPMARDSWSYAVDLLWKLSGAFSMLRCETSFGNFANRSWLLMLPCWSLLSFFGNLAELSWCYAVELLLESLPTALNSWCRAVDLLWKLGGAFSMLHCWPSLETLRRFLDASLEALRHFLDATLLNFFWKLCQPLLRKSRKVSKVGRRRSIKSQERLAKLPKEVQLRSIEKVPPSFQRIQQRSIKGQEPLAKFPKEVQQRSVEKAPPSFQRRSTA